MPPRTLSETVVKALRAMLTTPPNTWYRQWKRRSPIPGTLEDRAGYLTLKAQFSAHELIVGGAEVMQDWERPLMRALAQEAARPRGHVLEVGFGMGISAGYLIEMGCTRYTVIEPHPDVLASARTWADRQPVPVEIVPGFWQDVIDDLGLFDAILFDPIAVSTAESMDALYVPFIPKAAEHLRPGGVFTFFSATPDRIPPHPLALLERHFTQCHFYSVTGLTPPKDCQYYQSSRMLVPVCVK